MVTKEEFRAYSEGYADGFIAASKNQVFYIDEKGFKKYFKKGGGRIRA
jgi:hypothetical protein